MKIKKKLKDWIMLPQELQEQFQKIYFDSGIRNVAEKLKIKKENMPPFSKLCTPQINPRFSAYPETFPNTRKNQIQSTSISRN